MSGSCTRMAQVTVALSGRFLCPVIAHVRCKSLPSAIPIERATPQSGAPNSSQYSEGQSTIGRRDRTCVRCAWSCAMHVQTDIHTYIYIYIYVYIQIVGLLASLRSRHSAKGQELCNIKSNAHFGVH